MDITSGPEPDSLQFTEEIQNLLTLPLEITNSFTALLELPPNQAMELLHSSNSPTRPVFGNNPNASLTVSEEAEEALVTEKAGQSQVCLKRKEREINEVKGSSKKSKSKSKSAATKANEEERRKLPYVQVRARRGQATDSHSLAERARREKINARMKLLQELVPGCNKISGTALVLDEIINHVQSLQRHVEILSMRLATVNPRIDFNLDSILSADSGSSIHSNFPNVVMPLTEPDIQVIENDQSQYYQQWQLDVVHQPMWGSDNGAHNFVTPDDSLLSYDSSANSASLNLSQLKMEL